MAAVRGTVVIVDDHAEFRASARRLLEAEGFSVVGEGGDSQEAFEAVAKLRPSVVLLDIQMPGPDGLAVAERLIAGEDPPAVLSPRVGRRPIMAHASLAPGHVGSSRSTSSPASGSPPCCAERVTRCAREAIGDG
jgi:DNA-binding NarL/FixJ family response regulator